MTIGERIKQKRIELQLSQDELAKKVGYKSRSSIQKIESARKLPLSKVEIMASALDCSPGYLMGWEDKKDNKTIEEKLSATNSEKSERIKKIINILENSDPDVQDAVANLLESLQRKK